ncbi:MAG: hypothetical protein U1E77_14490 [Inhella sp.]
MLKRLSVLAALLSAVPLAAAAAPTIELQALPAQRRGHQVQCGQLQRPLDPTQPQGKTIDLHVVVVPALARNKLPDPVVFLAGGPGQSAVKLMPMLTGRLARLQRRDLVFVDQRGTGKSAPLECPEGRHLRRGRRPWTWRPITAAPMPAAPSWRSCRMTTCASTPPSSPCRTWTPCARPWAWRSGT